MNSTSRRRAILAALALLALTVASCRNVAETERPTAVVTAISATPEPAALPATTLPTATPESATELPPEPAPTAAPEAAPPAAEPPLGSDIVLAPGVIEYNLGDVIITQTRFPEDSRFRNMPVRLEGLISAPDAMDYPAPVVVILHGNHRGCPLDPDQHGVDPWPCTPQEEQPNYKGFDYLVRSLADEGYIALSINVNGEYTLGFGEGDFGERLSQILQLHLSALAKAAQGGPNKFGIDLAGKVDLVRLVFIGHSMGGELANFLTREKGWDSPYSLVDNGFGPVDGILLLAPSVNNAVSAGSTFPLGTILPACDGDVVQLSGQMFHEAVRKDPAFARWSTTVLLERGNHNGFNRILRADNSRAPGCDETLSATDQQAFLVDYARDYLSALWAAPPESLAAEGRLGLGATAPVPTQLYGLDARTVSLLPLRQPLLSAIDETEIEAAISSGRLHADGLDVLFCPDGFYTVHETPIAEPCRRPNLTQPGDPAQVKVSWTEPGAALRLSLEPGEQDVSAFKSLRLRAAVDPLSDLNAPGAPQSFRIALTDAEGQTADVVVPGSEIGLQYLLGEREDSEFLEQGIFTGIVHMSDIRVPLAAFNAIDLTRLATVEFLFDQTESGSLLLADIEFIRPEQVIGAYSTLLENATGANDGLNGVGRLNGSPTCTAVFLNVGGGPDAPAYVLTNGHCAQPWDANEVFTDLPADNINITFNYFVDTVAEANTVRANRAVYSTMKGRDLALLELDSTRGELIAQGITPLPLASAVPELPFIARVVGAPISGVPAEIAYLREESCQASGTADLFEFIWHFDDTLRNKCQDIYGGSSGSPVFAEEDNAIIALINTTNIGGTTPCTAGAPCEVAPEGVHMAADTSYATPVIGLGACFQDGQFDVSLPNCPLDQGDQLAISGYPSQPIQPSSLGTEGQAVPASWNAVLSGTLPFYRYKTGPAGLVQCRDESGYGEPISLANDQVIDDPLPAEEGSYVLCVVAGPSPTVDDSWQLVESATVVRAEIDITPPQQTPRVQIMRLGDEISIEPIFEVPELTNFRIKVGPPDTTDCATVDGYIIYRRIPVPITPGDLPVVVCVVGSDMAGNWGAPLEHAITGR